MSDSHGPRLTIPISLQIRPHCKTKELPHPRSFRDEKRQAQEVAAAVSNHLAVVQHHSTKVVLHGPGQVSSPGGRGLKGGV